MRQVGWKKKGRKRNIMQALTKDKEEWLYWYQIEFKANYQGQIKRLYKDESINSLRRHNNPLLFGFHLFVDSPVVFLLLISSLIPLWSENTLASFQFFELYCVFLLAQDTYSLSWDLFCGVGTYKNNTHSTVAGRCCYYPAGWSPGSFVSLLWFHPGG